MKKTKINSLLLLVFPLVVTCTTMTSCKKKETEKKETETMATHTPAPTPSQILASKKWKTTVVKDESANDVTADNMSFVGNAEYQTDGTFRIASFDGTLRSLGDWSITMDGKKRILIGRNLLGTGEIVFTRVVDIVTLTSELFTYSIVVNGKKLTVEHVPQ